MKKLIGTYDIGILGAGKYPKDGDETYIVSAVIEWPSMYGDREISSISVNVYNSPFCIDNYNIRWDEICKINSGYIFGA
ncbi:MAG: hypothetical protein ACLR7D_13890 [Lachnospira eligens]